MDDRRRLASWPSRVMASIVDGLLTGAVVLLVAAVAATDDGGRLVISLLGSLFYTVGMLTGKGRTLGNMVAGTRVVADDGAPRLPTGTVLVRWVAQVVLGLTVVGGVLDVLWPLWDSRNQTLHDKLAATLVVRELPTPL